MFGAEPQEFGARLRWFSAGEILQQANTDLFGFEGVGISGASVSVSTFSGDMESDWPMTINPGGGRVHPREWEFTIGAGSAKLSLESFSGTIYLRRGGAASRRGDR